MAGQVCVREGGSVLAHLLETAANSLGQGQGPQSSYNFRAFTATAWRGAPQKKQLEKLVDFLLKSLSETGGPADEKKAGLYPGISSSPGKDATKGLEVKHEQSMDVIIAASLTSGCVSKPEKGSTQV